MSIREIVQNFHNFCPKYILPLFEFSHCFCPKFSIAFAQISGKAMGKFGQKQWENSESGGIFFGQKLLLFPHFPLLLPEFSFAFSRISHCFCPNFPLLLPEFPTAFARIFRFHFFFFFLGGAQCPPPPPPTPICASPEKVSQRERGGGGVYDTFLFRPENFCGKLS